MVGEDGQVESVPFAEAMRRAAQAGLDLVEVAPDRDEPVCKLLSYSKFIYDSKKRTSSLKKKQKVTKIKEIKLRPTIGENDYLVKANNARSFIEEGHRVKVVVRLRGREMLFKELAIGALERFQKDLGDIAKPESPMRREGTQFHLMLVPIKS
jgi:translation initiation factor IF-3